jgi:hypothetical protein
MHHSHTNYSTQAVFTFEPDQIEEAKRRLNAANALVSSSFRIVASYMLYFLLCFYFALISLHTNDVFNGWKLTTMFVTAESWLSSCLTSNKNPSTLCFPHTSVCICMCAQEQPFNNLHTKSLLSTGTCCIHAPFRMYVYLYMYKSNVHITWRNFLLSTGSSTRCVWKHTRKYGQSRHISQGKLFIDSSVVPFSSRCFAIIKAWSESSTFRKVSYS